MTTPWQNKWLQMELHHPDIATMAKLAETWGNSWYYNKKDRKRWVVVVGDTGNGKTHVAKRLYRWAQHVRGPAWNQIWKDTSPNYVPGVEWFSWMHMASPEVMSGQAFEAALQDVDRSSVVFLDDCGTETDTYRTGVPNQRLCHLLNRAENKFLWVTTNVNPEAWADKWGRRCEDRLLSAEVVLNRAPSFRSEVSR